MAFSIGNVAVASTSSVTVQAGLALKGTSSPSFLSRGPLRCAPWTSSNGCVTLHKVLERPDGRVFVASRNGNAKELVVDNEGSPPNDLALANGTFDQFLGLDRETSLERALEDDLERLLVEKAREVRRDTQSPTIFLIGMMGSGKSTVGEVLAKALDYKFFDRALQRTVQYLLPDGLGPALLVQPSSDAVIESYVGIPVKEIFRQKNEEVFRELETRALRELSSIEGLVVATGGGAVCRRHNWAYLQNGITVWLDVPVEDLAKRVTAVGTESRPLLGSNSGAYEQALSRLSKLLDDRGAAYANADARLSFQSLAASLNLNVSELSPTLIAVQVLEEIKQLLKMRKHMCAPMCY